MAVSRRNAHTKPERRARALADPTRIALLELLSDGARPVSDLARSLGVPADRLYHHLDVLEQDGLVRLTEFAPKRLYEAVPFCGLDSQVLSETDRLELIDAVFDLVRADAESAHRRSEDLHIAVGSLRLTPRQLSTFAAEMKAVIERWSQLRPARGARRTRVIFGAIPTESPAPATDSDPHESK